MHACGEHHIEAREMVLVLRSGPLQTPLVLLDPEGQESPTEGEICLRLDDRPLLAVGGQLDLVPQRLRHPRQLVVAAVGLYSVVAYDVSQRTRELGLLPYVGER